MMIVRAYDYGAKWDVIFAKAVMAAKQHILGTELSYRP